LNLKELTRGMSLPAVAKRSTLSVTRSKKGRIQVLHFSGDLDMRTLSQAREAIGEILDPEPARRPAKGKKAAARPPGPPNVVIDLSKVEYIDSSGLGFFIGSLKKIKEFKGSLKLANLNAYMLGIFRLINMHYIIDVFDDLEKAVSSFGPTRRRSSPATTRARKE
jgi:anti-anti-sigma factor